MSISKIKRVNNVWKQEVSLNVSYLSLGFVLQTGSSCARKNGVVPLSPGVIVGVVGVEPGIAAAAAASLCCLSYSTSSFRDANTFCNSIMIMTI